MKKNNFIRKGIAAAIIILFIGLAFAPSTNANISKIIDKNQEIKTNNSTPQLGYILRIGLGLDIYVWNYGNETFQGNISCTFTTNARIILFNGYINISDYYLDIEPQEEVRIYRGLIIGFGFAEAVLDMPPPIGYYEEFKGFILGIFLFLAYK